MLEEFIVTSSLVAGIFICLILFYLILHHRKEKSARFILLLLIAEFIWSISYLFEIISPSKDLMIFASKIEYIGISIIPVAWFSFSATYVNKFPRIIQTRLFYLLMVIPTITIILVFTNEYHSLVWSKIIFSHIENYSIFKPRYGIWFWIHTFYSYILYGIGSILIIVDALLLPSIYRRRSAFLLIATLTPWIGSISYILRVITIDISPLYFSISMVLFLLAVYRYRLIEIIPMARDEIIENMEEAIIVLNNEDIIIDINPSMEKLLDISKDSIIGLKTEGVFSKYPDIIDLIISGKDFDKKMFSIEIDGDRRYYDAKLMLITDSSHNTLGKLIVIHDITEIKRAEEYAKEQENKLRLLNKTLEDKVKERTKEIEKLLQQKDEFINQLGHDLKTPLTPLTTLLPIIKDRVEDNELRELLDITIQSTLYMRNLILKTLQLAKLNTPSKINLDEIDLSEEMDKVLERNQALFKKYNIKIENFVEKGLSVKADRLYLNELLDNLINNAVKYNVEGGSIIIKAEEEGDEVKVSIQDTGIGMTEEQIERIFDEFYKVDPSRHDLDSSGLGLSIAKRIIDKHGGRIWVESPGLGKGSTFYFTLPICKKKFIKGFPDSIIERV